MNDFSITFPLQKVNKEKRTVTGIATANNIDQDGEIIDFDASLDAFKNWVGNIREMHDASKAVGKLVDWRPVSIMYKGVPYQAIEVEVYISKGAQDTWEKILDHTLKGFSIGGRTEKVERIIDKATGEYRNAVTKYTLGELSVVDNPCNPAGMFSIIKVAKDGTLVEAYENTRDVFYCGTDKYATMELSICPTCAEEMEKIGEVEDFDVDVINKFINEFDLKKEGGHSEAMDLHKSKEDDIVDSTMEDDLTSEQKNSLLAKVKNVIGIEEAVEKTADVIVPNVVVNITKGMIDEATNDLDDSEEEVESEVEDAIEKSVDIDTVEDDSDKEEDMDLEKMAEVFGSILDDKLEKFQTEFKAEVDEKIEGLEKSVSDTKTEVDEKIEETNDEIEKVANSGATQKSVSTEDEVDEDVIEKSAESESFWGGIFVTRDECEARGYTS